MHFLENKGMSEEIMEPQALPLAKVQGELLMELPQDLYIPPDALEVILEAFEGPLDFLLYLIRKQNINILDVPVAEITRQYMHYITMMKVLRIELAAEYLVMAATLTEIKSRLLLPKPEVVQDETDPRADLMRRLQEYEQIKYAAEALDRLTQQSRDTFLCRVPLPLALAPLRPPPELDLVELLQAYQDVMARAALFAKHAVTLEPLSVREQMIRVLGLIKDEDFTSFSHLLLLKEGRLGVVVTFLAILELLKQAAIDIAQEAPYGALYVRPAH
ncbi:MAG: segregation/condensation protein A [Gammaproteobacteria bacterium]|nr:segregation/condensation protein A [Gammaproteobacteria bacterium]